MSSNETSDQEVFENCFLHFINALRVLSHDAAVQCEEMGNYNTPQEIQNDTVAGGLGSLRMSATYLSWEQAEKLVDLLGAVRRLPEEALSVPHMDMTSQYGCLTAMNHPSWAPLRIQAKELLAQLQPAIARNQLYFGLSPES